MLQRGPAIHEDITHTAPDTPEGALEAFFEYLNLEFWHEVAEQTNLYSVQSRDSHRSVNVTSSDVIHLTGIQVLMGSLKLPQARMYWSRDFDFPLIRNSMSRDRFFEIRKYLHFVNNLSVHDEDDRLWKVRLFIDQIKNKCITLPRPSHLAIDEQMIPFSGRCKFRQYVPSKPCPLGLKNFVLASRDGMVLDFHIYSGKGTVSESDRKEYGVGGSIVKLLIDTVPKNGNHVIYTDRFFTSIKTADFCLNNNIHQIGTVMKNRIGPVVKKLVDDKHLKRGEWEEKVRADDNLCILKWKDNKSVLMLSTCMGSEPLEVCKRWCKEDKKRIEVPQPAVVNAYNKNMGGIDLCDRYLAYYRCVMRTKKWPTRTFNHFVDLIIVNCWLMYRRSCQKAKLPKSKCMSLLAYRLHMATALIKYDARAPILRLSLRGQPQVEEDISDAPDDDDDDDDDNTPPLPKYRKVVPQPIAEVRYDMVGHLPQYSNDKFPSKCRLPGCKSKSRVKCTKCEMYLCILKNNCFEKYHKK